MHPTRCAARQEGRCTVNKYYDEHGKLYSRDNPPQAPTGQQAQPTDEQIPMAYRGREKGAWLDGYRAALAGQQAEPSDATLEAWRQAATDLRGMTRFNLNIPRIREAAKFLEDAYLAGQQAERPAPAGQAVGRRIDAAAEALSKVLAFVKLHAYEDEVSRALAGLRSLQALAASQAVQEDGNGSTRPETPKCCSCGTTKGLRKDGLYGWRCSSNGCAVF